MRRLWLATAVTCGLSALAAAQKNSPPAVPDAIKAPAREMVILVAHASGAQVYTCQAGADGKFSWTLKAPDAELHDLQGTVIGKHYAGPSWQLNDGSEVTGKMTAHADSPDADAIPWLLVNVSSHSGSGMLSGVTTIQRLNTTAGKAPATGCDEAHRNAETRSHYMADYYFYAPAQ